jgi:hypothetical protein
MADLAHSLVTAGHDGGTRRDFLILTAGALGGIGAACAIWPFIDSLNPAKDTLALSTTEVDLAPVQAGQRLTIAWRGKPVFIDHRPPEEIKAAQDVDVASLRDPQPDSARVKKPEWLVIIGVCLLVAGIRVDPLAAGGLEGAIEALLVLPLGPWMAGLVGVGFFAYAIFCVFRARYARL